MVAPIWLSDHVFRMERSVHNIHADILLVKRLLYMKAKLAVNKMDFSANSLDSRQIDFT